MVRKVGDNGAMKAEDSTQEDSNGVVGEVKANRGLIAGLTSA